MTALKTTTKQNKVKTVDDRLLNYFEVNKDNSSTLHYLQMYMYIGGVLMLISVAQICFHQYVPRGSNIYFPTTNTLSN